MVINALGNGGTYIRLLNKVPHDLSADMHYCNNLILTNNNSILDKRSLLY